MLSNVQSRTPRLLSFGDEPTLRRFCTHCGPIFQEVFMLRFFLLFYDVFSSNLKFNNVHTGIQEKMKLNENMVENMGKKEHKE